MGEPVPTLNAAETIERHFQQAIQAVAALGNCLTKAEDWTGGVIAVGVMKILERYQSDKYKLTVVARSPDGPDSAAHWWEQEQPGGPAFNAPVANAAYKRATLKQKQSLDRMLLYLRDLSPRRWKSVEIQLEPYGMGDARFKTLTHVQAQDLFALLQTEIKLAKDGAGDQSAPTKWD